MLSPFTANNGIVEFGADALIINCADGDLCVHIAYNYYST